MDEIKTSCDSLFNEKQKGNNTEEPNAATTLFIMDPQIERKSFVSENVMFDVSVEFNGTVWTLLINSTTGYDEENNSNLI